MKSGAAGNLLPLSVKSPARLSLHPGAGEAGPAPVNRVGWSRGAFRRSGRFWDESPGRMGVARLCLVSTPVKGSGLV